MKRFFFKISMVSFIMYLCILPFCLLLFNSPYTYYFIQIEIRRCEVYYLPRYNTFCKAWCAIGITRLYNDFISCSIHKHLIFSNKKKHEVITYWLCHKKNENRTNIDLNFWLILLFWNYINLLSILEIYRSVCINK